MGEIIRLHKNVNDTLKVGGNEILAETFFNLIELYNQQQEYKDLELTKAKLWSLTGYEGEYNSIKIKRLIKKLTQGRVFDVSLLDTKKIIISGSLFIISEGEDDIRIYVPEPFRKYLFYKKDIDLLTKAKKKEKMSVGELDYYDNHLKEKKKFFMLLNKAEMLGLKGKYSLRLYALLKQWEQVGELKKEYKVFKEIMDFPNSILSGQIDRYINKAKFELLKANIEITKIEKIKKGRIIDKIRIQFKTVKPSNVPNVKIQDKKIESSYKGNKDVKKVTREDTIRKMIIEKTHINDINRILKVFKYEETTLEECISILNKE